MRLLILISLVALSGISAEESEPETEAGSRQTRATVYHIRPVSSRNRDSGFGNLDGIREFQFPTFGLKNGGDSLAQASSSRYEDTTAEESVQLPPYLQLSSASSEEEEVEVERRGENKRRKVSKSVAQDASYAFGFSADDQSRQEVSDAGGNVKGYYQYVDDEGYVRKVEYTAGPGKGFVVLKKERLKGPHPPSTKRKVWGSGSGSPEPSLDITPAESSNQLPANGFRDSESEGGEAEEAYEPPPPQLSHLHATKKKKPIYIVKIRRPSKSHQQQPETEEDVLTADHDLTPQRLKPKKLVSLPPIPAPSDRFRARGPSQLQSPMVLLAGGGGGDGSEGYDDGSYRPEYQYQSTGSSEDPEYPHPYDPSEKPDASYSFGYETETANRLEKADGNGNVRGSYSYIDSAGIKRTVHYIAGASTGFQILGSSPSASRSVRLEAPSGYVVSRRRAPKQSRSEFQFPESSAIVYHIHPDSQWKPWEGTERRKPRKMRKVMRVHRKKSKVSSNAISTTSPRTTKPLEFQATQKELDRSEVVFQSREPQDYQRSFRHSTRVSTLRPEIFEAMTRKRHASHRAYTDQTDSSEDDEGHRNEQILFSPNYEALNEAQESRRVPNPILLKAPSVRIVNRGTDASTPFEVAESKVYPVRSEVTDEGMETAESINTRRGYMTASEAEDVVPVLVVTDQVTETEPSTTVSPTTTSTTTVDSPAPTRSSRPFRSTTTVDTPRSSGRPPVVSTVLTTVRSGRRRGEGQIRTAEPKTASPTAVRMTREETAKSSDDVTMSMSSRLLQRLGSAH